MLQLFSCMLQLWLQLFYDRDTEKTAPRLQGGLSFERVLRIGNGWLVYSALVEFRFAFRKRFAAFPCVLLIIKGVQSSLRCPAVSLIHPIVQPSALLLFLVCQFWNSRYCEPPSTICSTSAMISFNSSGVGFSMSRRIKWRSPTAVSIMCSITALSMPIYSQ